jgi:hypothetical protein
MVDKNVGGLDRIGRAVLAVVLTVVAISALKQGNHSKGLVTGLAALGAGFNATTGVCGLNKTLGIDTAGEE